MSELKKLLTESSTQLQQIEIRSPRTIPTSYYPLIGESEVMIRVKKQVAFAASVDFPVFISGELGTEKKSVAYSIHCQRGLRADRFVYVPANMHNLPAYIEYLSDGIKQAREGTLYLSEVDLLSAEKKDYLISLFTQEAFQYELTSRNVNLVISCTEPLLIVNGNNQFLAKLLGHTTPHLELYLPPLKERKQDIPQHINHILKKLSYHSKLQLSPDAMTLLKEYEWPENLTQLQRAIMVIASCRRNNDIQITDIHSAQVIDTPNDTRDIIDDIRQNNFTSYEHIHPSLLKALHFMSLNYTESISLADLSNASYTSPSHLSYLFREFLGHSFKTILVQLRVREAKEKIERSPMSKITEISFCSGFGDLSHFEKMFKRYVGCTPRQFRQQRRNQVRVS